MPVEQGHTGDEFCQRRGDENQLLENFFNAKEDLFRHLIYISKLGVDGSDPTLLLCVSACGADLRACENRNTIIMLLSLTWILIISSFLVYCLFFNMTLKFTSFSCRVVFMIQRSMESIQSPVQFPNRMVIINRTDKRERGRRVDFLSRRLVHSTTNTVVPHHQWMLVFHWRISWASGSVCTLHVCMCGSDTRPTEHMMQSHTIPPWRPRFCWPV